MKICQPHWDRLRKEIEDKGMTHLVAKNGEEVVARLSEELQHKEAPYDPLMSCHFMILNNALKIGGSYLLTGDYCPICEAMKHLNNVEDPTGKIWTSEEIEKEWIEGPTNGALEYCKEHNLL